MGVYFFGRPLSLALAGISAKCTIQQVFSVNLLYKLTIDKSQKVWYNVATKERGKSL